ncbi:hypothetical protein ACQ4PT_066076 [Festuca glaucescens]
MGSSFKLEWGPAICMVLIELFTTGQMLLTKVVVDAGLFVFVLLTYRFFLGAALVVPLAMIFERFTIPGLYYIGLGDTSPGYAINFYNIIPIATFILAVLCRKEPLDMRTLVGNIKVALTVVCVGGTLVVSLYKGKVLHLWPTNIIGYHPKADGSAIGHHHVRGTVLLITSCLSLAVWYTVQAQMLKVFPYKYWSTVCTCFVGSIQMAVVGVIMNREKATWELKWNMSLLTIVYSAILNTAAKFVMISWVVTKRGPTYPSMFCAVSVFFTTVLDSMLLGHDLSVGRGKLKELKLKAFIWIFTSSLVGFTIPGLYYIALGDTSPGYAINFYNIIPIATFILAVLFRKEPLDMRSLVGNIKIAGTLICVGGTLEISLYKGKELHLWPTNIVDYHSKQAGTAFGHHHVRGTVLLITTCLGIAIWYTVQAILNTTAKFVMISWVVTQRGPTYPSMFGAVSVFFTTVLDSLLLGHDLSVGRALPFPMGKEKRIGVSGCRKSEGRNAVTEWR